MNKVELIPREISLQILGEVLSNMTCRTLGTMKRVCKNWQNELEKKYPNFNNLSRKLSCHVIEISLFMRGVIWIVGDQRAFIKENRNTHCMLIENTQRMSRHEIQKLIEVIEKAFFKILRDHKYEIYAEIKENLKKNIHISDLKRRFLNENNEDLKKMRQISHAAKDRIASMMIWDGPQIVCAVTSLFVYLFSSNRSFSLQSLLNIIVLYLIKKIGINYVRNYSIELLLIIAAYHIAFVLGNFAME